MITIYGEYEIETNGLYNTILKIEYEKMSIVVSPKLIKPMLQSENFNEYLILDVDDNEHDFDKELVIKRDHYQNYGTFILMLLNQLILKLTNGI